MLYGRKFPLLLKGAVYKSYVRLAILYGSEAWCMKESENLKEMRKLEFCEGQKDQWLVQCVECSSKTEKDLRI